MSTDPGKSRCSAFLLLLLLMLAACPAELSGGTSMDETERLLAALEDELAGASSAAACSDYQALCDRATSICGDLSSVAELKPRCDNIAQRCSDNLAAHCSDGSPPPPDSDATASPEPDSGTAPVVPDSGTAPQPDSGGSTPPEPDSGAVPACGDGSCDGTEDCVSCPSDCVCSETCQSVALIYENHFEATEDLPSSSGTEPAISSDHAADGTSSHRARLTESSPTIYRAESSLNKEIHFLFDQEYWAGFSTRVDPDLLSFPGDLRCMIWQMHYRGWLYPDVIDAQPGVLRYVSEDGADPYILVQQEVLADLPGAAPGADRLAEVPAHIGQWTDWVVHFRLSESNAGLFEVWQNGTLVAAHYGPNHSLGLPADEWAYMKFGLYCSHLKNHNGGSFQITAYFDRLRVADADGCYASVDPAQAWSP